MAKLTAKARRKLPASAFAYPSKRAYPIHDRTHAKAALAFAARSSTSGTYAHVAARVNKKFPGLAKGRKGSTGRKRSSTRRTARRRR